MRNRIFLIVWFCLLVGFNAIFAQQSLRLRVASFEIDQTDLTRPKTDKGSGEPYALIKVTSDNSEDDLSAYRFDFGLLNSESELRDGELWVYVQKNAKRMTIMRTGYTTIRKYDMGYTLESGKVYRMELSAQTPEVKFRIVQLKVDPPSEHAIVKVKVEGTDSDYELWGSVDGNGSIDRRLETGNAYLYEVSADHFATSEGRIVLSNGDENHVENVKLTPNFGYREVDDTYGIAGAEIYVNNRKIGTVPYTGKERFDVRDDYHIMISNGELYKTYNGSFVIRRGETTKLSPKLESNFAETTLNVGNNAEIWINGAKKGQDHWTGPLKAGTYDIECRLNHHRSTRRQITVRPNVAETFTLDTPIPIIGNVYVTSNPSGASIKIDDKVVGTTPNEIKSVLEGNHKLSVTLEGYRTEEKTIYVEEGKTTELSFILHDFAKFKISSSPRSRLILNGEDVGSTPYSFEGASGEYDIMMTAPQCKTYHKKVLLKSSEPDFKINLLRQYQQPTNGYVHLGMQVGALMAAEATLGGYISNINVEASYLFGIDKSEEIYWNYAGTGSQQDPILCTYKPTAYGVKVGYGIISGTRMRITPQVGATIVSIKSDGGESKCHVTSGTIGARLDYAITSHFGVYAAPELSLAISKSSIYEQLSEVSSKIKGWGNGFNARLGLSIFF